MDSQNRRNARVESLIRQDREIKQTDFKEFRMQLEASLIARERSAKRVRRIAWFGAAVLIVDALVLLSIETVPALRDSSAREWCGIVGAFALVLTGGCLIWYRDRTLPGIRGDRTELLMSMVRELHQEVERIRRDMPTRTEESH